MSQNQVVRTHPQGSPRANGGTKADSLDAFSSCAGHRWKRSAGMKRGIVRNVGAVAAVAAVFAAVGVPLVEATSTPAGAAATACSAATKTWTGGAGSASWDDANNWSPAGAP